MYRTESFSLSPIKAVELAAAKMPGVVSLAQGIPSFDTPESIKRFMAEKMAAGVTAKYSLAPGLPQVREVVAENLARDGMDYDPDTEILITAGTIAGINAALLTILSPGDEVVIPTPAYASYQNVVKIAHGVPVFVPMHEKDGWQLDLPAIKKAVTKKTKAIFFSNPNNPTGTVYTEAELRGLAEIAEKHDLYLITDEVYKDFIYDESPYWSLAQEPALRKRVIRAFGFSKAYAMTGYRIGFLHTQAELLTEILKVHDALVTCAPVISQYGAIAAFDYAAEDVAKFREEFLWRRDYIVKRLGKLGDVFTFHIPPSGYFLFPRVAEPDEEMALDILNKALVATVPGSAFGSGGEKHLRMCYGVARETLETAMDRIGEYVKGAA